MSQKHAWGLFGKDGEFIAAFRFRPTRVYRESTIYRDGVRAPGYYLWKYGGRVLEVTMNATCKKIAVPKPIKSRA